MTIEERAARNHLTPEAYRTQLYEWTVDAINRFGGVEARNYLDKIRGADTLENFLIDSYLQRTDITPEGKVIFTSF